MMPLKNILINITQNRTGRHLLFWLATLLAITVAESSSESQEQDFLNILGGNTINLIAPIIAAYLLNYFLLPKLFQRKQYLSFLLLFSISAYLICVFSRILNVHVAEPLFRQGHFEQEAVAEIFVQLESLLTLYFPGIFFIAFAMTLLRQQKAHVEIKQRNVLLEKDKAETELNFLKAQIHPHFLFNTLNNLYVLTLKKSDKAPEIVVKLSEILDYILYRGNDAVVAVEKEIKLLENYISLEKLRYGDYLQISFHQDVDDLGTGIAPLLLLSIVENAFKHGASNQLTEPIINIELSLRNQNLLFKVYNTKEENAATDDANYRNGIGVSNIRRQLALIYVDYNFEVREEKNSYLVILSINLKDMRKSRL